jgi:UPF0716 protein FxsA
VAELRRRRGPGWGTWLAVALLVVPLLELYVVIQVGQVIGAWPTIVLLLAESALGAWLLRREGPAAWRRVQDALRRGRMPSAELTDAALVLVGGTLLLTPGFLTDVAGFFCILPPTRPVARRALLAALRRRATVMTFGGGAGRVPPGYPRHPGQPGDVVQGEVIDPDGPDRDGPAAPGG